MTLMHLRGGSSDDFVQQTAMDWADSIYGWCNAGCVAACEIRWCHSEIRLFEWLGALRRDARAHVLQCSKENFFSAAAFVRGLAAVSHLCGLADRGAVSRSYQL